MLPLGGNLVCSDAVELCSLLDEGVMRACTSGHQFLLNVVLRVFSGRLSLCQTLAASISQ